MSFFKKILGSKTKAAAETVSMADCVHATLAPKWDNAADIGKNDRASRFECDACHKSFTPEDALTVRGSLAEALRTPEQGA